MMYLDTNILIYAIEQEARYGKSCTRILLAIEKKRLTVCASTLVLIETLGALRKLNGILRRRRQPEFDIPKNIAVIVSLPIIWYDVTATVVERAARYTIAGQTADHLHLASAELAGAEQILSADVDFDRFPGIQRVDPLKFTI